MAVLIPSGDNWKYIEGILPLGQSGSVSDPLAWTQLNYLDNSWQQGGAQLGYGDGDEITTISSGSDPNNKFITTYFRNSFNVSDPASIDWLTARILRDDGAVVYLNGVEIFRSNMPGGEVNNQLLASSSLGGTVENSFTQNITIDPSLLQIGNNVIAVEIHQSSPSSSDLSFDFELNSGTFTTLTTPSAQYRVNQPPRIQLGNAPLVGFAGSQTDRIEILWQTKSAGNGTQDSFVVEYRPVGTTNWIGLDFPNQLETTVEGRIIHSVEITGLNYNSNYEYRVQHLRAGQLVDTYQASFKTRLPAGDNTAFSFAAYGDSALTGNVANFLTVQQQINTLDRTNSTDNDPNTLPLEFTLLLGDNVYNNGSHRESDARFDPNVNPLLASLDPNLATAANQWTASHIDYFSIGNHDNSTNNGKPSEDNFSVPIPVGGVNSPVALPAGERREHNYSFDYGNVHFVTFDSNSLNNPQRLDGLLTWVEQDILAAQARPLEQRPDWIIAFPHHPIAGVPDKPQKPGDNYYQQVVSRLNQVGVDLYLVGHSHTFSWTYPLLGQEQGTALFVQDNDKNYAKGAGLIQAVSGVGGKSLRSGSYSQFPFVASGYTTDTNPPLEDAFTQIEVTTDAAGRDLLKVNFIAADNGAILDSFTIVDDPSASPDPGDIYTPTISLSQPLDNGPSDFNPSFNALLLNETQSSFQFTLNDIGTGIDNTTVNSNAISLTRDSVNLVESIDYTFNYDRASQVITLTPLNSNAFENGNYQINISNQISDLAAPSPNQLNPAQFNFSIDTNLQIISFQQRANNYNGTVDTYLQAAAPDVNNSTATSLNIDASDGGLPVHGLIRFDNIFGTENGQINPNSQIIAASLELQVFGPGSQLEFYRMLQPWNDTDTWNGLGNGIQADGVEASNSPDFITVGDVGTGLLAVDVTNSLQAWQSDPSTNFGWAILPTGTNGVDLFSSDNDPAPKLIIEYADPTPALVNITGTNLNDSLVGNVSADSISGLDGNDTLRGKGGDDILIGAGGNDLLKGNNDNDSLDGGINNDTLVGGTGIDTLTGGSGRDFFQFEDLSNQVDLITDFNVADGDKIRVLSTAFSGLSIGRIQNTQFHYGTSATSVDHRFIYDLSTGSLFFDADGSGTIAQVHFATLTNQSDLFPNEITVI